MDYLVQVKAPWSWKWKDNTDRHSHRVLDGDNLRSGINQDLGFEKTGKGISGVSAGGKDAFPSGIIVLVSSSSLCKFRTHAKSIIGGDTYREIYVHASFDAAENASKASTPEQSEEVQSLGQESAREPSQAELILNTESDNLEGRPKLLSYIKKHFK